ncbi:unnamed protein product [Onchocerca flexuosa]|uniref:Uncharacterized protein n=1 Tax=Onchocerca flexuosa TaxID=387005 RepID=A0A183HS10_9BILA|nr:unnamed protein product [Onchocerca flexuosa]
MKHSTISPSQSSGPLSSHRATSRLVKQRYMDVCRQTAGDDKGTVGKAYSGRLDVHVTEIIDRRPARS